MTPINNIIDCILSGNDIRFGVISDKFEYEKYLNAVTDWDKFPMLYNDDGVTDILPMIRDTWLIPKEFLDLDVEQYLLSLCKNEIELTRVKEELYLYKKYDLYNILKLMIYIVSVFRKNNIVWGVGRGSSVASYCLYLIGIHKVNSIKYGLNITDFLKD